MDDLRERVIYSLERCSCMVPDACRDCSYDYLPSRECVAQMAKDALSLLKAQEQRHRLEVHNICNVDIPDGVTEEQFHAIMNNVVEALEHTEKGESWPYDQPKEDENETAKRNP